jgi:excisionase family DNA binding protein
MRTTSHDVAITPPRIGTSGAEHASRQLLTIEQLSDWLQVPKQTVYKWRSRGGGPPGFRIGKHVRFEVGEVERWLSKLDRE